MKFLKNILSNIKEYQKLDAYLENGNGPIGVTGLSLIHKSHIIYSICTNRKYKALIISSDESEAQKFARDISSMGLKAYIYPLRDFDFRDVESKSREYEHQRLNVLMALVNREFDVLIACIDAAVQYTIPKDILENSILSLKVSQTVKLEKITDTLISSGYTKYDQVEGQGQFALRGGILDIFPPDFASPIRIEFFSDEIDTISYFDVETQRRTKSIESVLIAPSTEVLVNDKYKLSKKIDKLSCALRGKTAKLAKEILNKESEKLEQNIIPGSIDKFIPLIYDNPSTLFDYINDEDIIFMSEPASVKERMKNSLWQWSEDLKDYLSSGVLTSNLSKYSEDLIYAFDKCSEHKFIYLDTFFHSNYDIGVKDVINFVTKQISVWSGSVNILTEDLESSLNDKSMCVILAGTKKAAQSLAHDLSQRGINCRFSDDLDDLPRGTAIIMEGSLSTGFEYPSIPFMLITHSNFLKSEVKRKKKNKNTKDIYDLSDLNIGDYVVHSAHGIGIFEGIHKISMNSITKDYIKVKYAKNDTLYVPVTQLDMISKYIGPRENNNVKINRLGSSDWQRSKARVKSAVKDMAKELIKIYSERMHSKGFAFSEDNEWQRDFESHFEYEETLDQLKCIEEIKKDMESTAPMDRLLCGDVGFGKTEVALRAAFKCVTDSKQCAILVPTTILAWQHYQNVIKRFEQFPVRIELLSRFRTPKQQKDILKRLKNGEIDIIIGTHRLVQKDVIFRDLGLAIIDEEQRFGVSHKERFKDICKNVDVLTLSATPIPRTLNMAMSGIRDMSTLEEAPGDRYPVQTYVLEHDIGIINDAIKRELRRGGQVYYLHNRVETIDKVANNISINIPEAKVSYAHGKMSESELSEVWRKMIDQEINVLVCTTIIETGVDIPNANTLIIEDADRMGLSQLHQLRGRVGRSSRRAYAYFTFTKNKVLSEISQKRLSAIREFTEFGSGFKIAMRDLELRGAGNILGAEQHGNMQDVGYDMYIKLLNEAVSEEKGEKSKSYEIECLVDLQVQAYIPENYITNVNQRLDIYRRISDIRSDEDARDVIDELIDRFSDVPSSVKGLIDIALIRNTAASLSIYEIKQRNDCINLYQKNLDMQSVSKLIKSVSNKVMVNAGQKPYISIKLNKQDNPIKVLSQALNVILAQDV